MALLLLPGPFPYGARQMEVYAGVMEYADHHIGRVIDAVDEFACEQLAVCST